MKTKPFDLQAAKNGAKLVTKFGDTARIICYDRIGDYPIVALVSDEEFMLTYDNNGMFSIDHKETDMDLLILDESEPIYKPYETTAELMDEIKKHGAWVKCKYGDKYNQITGFYYDAGMYIELYSDFDYMSGDFLAKYVWADDNTPCGKLVEE